MKRSEFRWVLFFSFALLLVTSLPYLLGYQRAGNEWQFTGFVFGVDDGNSYIAKMLRGAEGDWLFRTPYSAVPQAGFVGFLPYLLLGKLTAQPGQHEQLVALFHLYRWAGGFLLAWAVYQFAALFLADERQRRFATALALAGGGLGWLAMLGLGAVWGERVPLEFYSPESFGFLSLFGLPHLEVSRALLLLGLVAYLRPVGNRLGWFLPGVLWLAMGFFQPLTIVSGWAVVGMYVLLRGILCLRQAKDAQPGCRAAWRAEFLRAVVTGLISAPWVVYNFAAFQIDPYLRGWAQQNLILSPPVGDYLLAYGVVLILAVTGVRAVWKDHPRAAILLAGWMIAFPLLAYFPYPLQRRLPEGLWVALAVLGTAGFASLQGFWKKLATAFLALSFFPALLLLLGALLSTWTPQAPLFLPAYEVKAFQFVREYAARDAVVLASFEVSNRIVAWAPVRTITGHGPESVGAEEINGLVERFWQAQTPDAERVDLIRRFHIDYLVVEAQDLLPDGWDPSRQTFLKSVYRDEAGQVRVYAVDRGMMP